MQLYLSRRKKHWLLRFITDGAVQPAFETSKQWNETIWPPDPDHSESILRCLSAQISFFFNAKTRKYGHSFSKTKALNYSLKFSMFKPKISQEVSVSVFIWNFKNTDLLLTTKGNILLKQYSMCSPFSWKPCPWKRVQAWIEFLSVFYTFHCVTPLCQLLNVYSQYTSKPWWYSSQV